MSAADQEEPNEEEESDSGSEDGVDDEKGRWVWNIYPDHVLFCGTNQTKHHHVLMKMYPDLPPAEKSELEATLRKAICQGDDKKVKELLEEHPDINIDAVDNVNQFTMLHYAGISGRTVGRLPQPHNIDH